MKRTIKDEDLRRPDESLNEYYDRCPPTKEEWKAKKLDESIEEYRDKIYEKERREAIREYTEKYRLRRPYETREEWSVRCPIIMEETRKLPKDLFTFYTNLTPTQLEYLERCRETWGHEDTMKEYQEEQNRLAKEREDFLKEKGIFSMFYETPREHYSRTERQTHERLGAITGFLAKLGLYGSTAEATTASSPTEDSSDDFSWGSSDSKAPEQDASTASKVEDSSEETAVSSSSVQTVPTTEDSAVSDAVSDEIEETSLYRSFSPF